MAQGSFAHYQLVASLKKAGLGIEDVQVKYLQPADALAAFTGGKVDAWAVWDPYTSQVLRRQAGPGADHRPGCRQRAQLPGGGARPR